MKKIFFIFLLVTIAFSCTKSTGILAYFSEKESQELLVNIATFVFSKAPMATNQTKFNAEFKKYYTEKAKGIHIEKIEQLEDSSYAFFLVRKVGSLIEFKRGVIGKFKLKEGSMMPLEFEEIVNTPHLKEHEVIERGSFLFRKYVENKNLNEFLAMKQYIEWPDSTLNYDKKNNEWVKP
jgi:hypothetical protein